MWFTGISVSGRRDFEGSTLSYRNTKIRHVFGGKRGFVLRVKVGIDNPLMYGFVIGSIRYNHKTCGTIPYHMVDSRKTTTVLLTPPLFSVLPSISLDFVSERLHPQRSYRKFFVDRSHYLLIISTMSTPIILGRANSIRVRCM